MFSNGKIWVEQRRFSHRQMKDFGFGRTGMEPLIVEEAIKMKNVLTKRVGKPTSLKLQVLFTMFKGSIFLLFYAFFNQ